MLLVYLTEWRLNVVSWKILSLFAFELNQVCHQRMVLLRVYMDLLQVEGHAESGHIEYLTRSKPSLGIERG